MVQCCPHAHREQETRQTELKADSVFSPMSTSFGASGCVNWSPQERIGEQFTPTAWSGCSFLASGSFTVQMYEPPSGSTEVLEPPPALLPGVTWQDAASNQHLYSYLVHIISCTSQSKRSIIFRILCTFGIHGAALMTTYVGLCNLSKMLYFLSFCKKKRKKKDFNTSFCLGTCGEAFLLRPFHLYH